MSKIKIETLTNVHIGSGNMLYLNNDYCETDDKGRAGIKGFKGFKAIGVIDLRKVVNLIGEEHIDELVTSIERQKPVTEIINRYAGKAGIESYTSRLIDKQSGAETDTLKELIHDGLGRAYIPGSSIKGAIRTAVFASLMQGRQPALTNRNGYLLKGSLLEGDEFGKTPNDDVFRYVQVGDALFENILTKAALMVNINERRRQSYWDEKKPQLVEIIGSGEAAAFDMRLKGGFYHVNRLPSCLQSIPALFDTINNHTRRLLKQEIDYWNERPANDDFDKVDKYIAECELMLSHAEACQQGKTCVLRVGHGSGWRFITGAWTEGSHDFDKVIEKARPRNYNYKGYEFPKTRRVTKGCHALGFVRLTLE